MHDSVSRQALKSIFSSVLVERVFSRTLSSYPFSRCAARFAQARTPSHLYVRGRENAKGPEIVRVRTAFIRGRVPGFLGKPGRNVLRFPDVLESPILHFLLFKPFSRLEKQ